MGDFISREAAIVNACKGLVDFQSADYVAYDVKENLKAIPAADVVEVRYCRFSLEEARRRESVYKCSACGNYLTVRADTLNGGRADMNYCPFCGGKVMHEGQDGGPDDV